MLFVGEVHPIVIVLQNYYSGTKKGCSSAFPAGSQALPDAAILGLSTGALAMIPVAAPSIFRLIRVSYR
ncbi:hypothetical protein GALL_120830 [mine drainage metagenome]|uniref:Uncharacterized protein n=1 Tax=mine drainage metagenome TaxID=410659 RepID=A0A1J5SCK1_9ZZZZ